MKSVLKKKMLNAENNKLNKMSKKCYNSLLCQIILVLMCVASYLHSMMGDGNGNFIFDDVVAIVKNTDVSRLPTNLTQIFLHDFWGTDLTDAESHKSFRPLTTLMFHIEYSHLRLGAKHMKLLNLFLHGANTLFVWRLIRSLHLDQFQRNDRVATIAGAIFAVHPVHTEAVCGIVGRADLMFCLFYLLALLLGRNCSEMSATVLVLSLTGIGMLFKETSITIPLACIFFDYMTNGVYVHHWRKQFRLLLSRRNILYTLFTLIFLYLRLWLQNFESPRFKPMDNPIAANSDPLTRILSQNFLFALNVWILVCPQWLSFDWAGSSIDLITNIWDLRLQAVLALYSCIAVTVINYRSNFVHILGLGLMVIPFLPACGIINVGFVIAERVLYVPSIGFCLLIAYSFVHLYEIAQQRWLRKILTSMLMLMITAFLLRTRQRSNEWRTEEKLFTSALDVCPKNAKVHYNIARLATDKVEREKAFHHYHKAIELFPQYESALMNLGNLYREAGDLGTAEKYIKAALEVLPEFPAAWMNLGIVQSARKQYVQALQSYKNALIYRKNYAVCYYNMGNLLLDQQLYSEAMHHWKEAVALNPRQPKAWANILTMLDNRGFHEDAIRLSATALDHLPNETGIMFIRANVFGKRKQYVEAEILYKRVIIAEPLNSLYHTNLGVLYHRWGKLKAASESYRRAIDLSPEKSSTARKNLSKLLARMRNET